MKNYKINISSFAAAVIFLSPLLFSSCGNKEAPAEEHHDDSATTVVDLTVDQQKAIGLQFDTITFRNLSTSLKVNGTLELPPQNKAQVSVLAGGIVKTINIKEGELVTENQTLATVENLDFLQLQQDYLEDKSNLALATAEFERQKELQKENINAAKTFQQAESNYHSQQAKVNSRKLKLKLYNVDVEKLSSENISSYFRITAPISGHITHITISIGQYIDPNKMIFEIVDNRFLHLDLTIFEQDIHKIHEGQTLTFSDANDPSHIHTAEIFSINKAFENDRQAVIAHAKILHDTEKLLPGMYIQARININSENTATLPDEAIVSNGNEHYIFVQQQENHFRQVQVRTGASDMGFTEITPLEEIQRGQKIIVKGSYYLFSQLTKGSGEHHD
jgi:cobalt-zinc-cadmium efflux system membrane fusion protein